MSQSVDYEKPIDVRAERDRLTKEISPSTRKAWPPQSVSWATKAFSSQGSSRRWSRGSRKQAAETRLLLEKAHVALVCVASRNQEAREKHPQLLRLRYAFRSGSNHRLHRITQECRTMGKA
jgi:hypothetical protein